MFKFKSNNFFYEKKITNLVKQKKLFFYDDYLTEDFDSINLEFSSSSMKVQYKNKTFIASLPIDIGSFFQKIKTLLADFYIIHSLFKYFPFNQSLISNNNTRLFLRDTHNIILFNLLIRNKNGMSKINLYKSIWPNDKNIQMNKLDTHLTNIKNYLSSEANIKIEMGSEKNIIKIN